MAARRAARSGWQAAAVLVGLAGVAVTQPVLDLLGRNPEFFVAGAYRPSQIVQFALVVACAPAAVAVLTTALLRLVARPVGDALHTLFVFVLAGAFGLVAGHSAGVTDLVPALALGVVTGLVVAVAERRWQPARRFLSYLALGNLVFLLLFLFASPTTELIAARGTGLQGDVAIPPLEGPVIVVVLDEFPLTTIMRPDGTINAARYPRLAELATTSTWFRNASSDYPLTSLSAPTILSGVRADNGDLPTYTDHPRNLFTMFRGEDYPIRRYEVVTDMCPPAQCPRATSSSLGDALSDASVVYGHRALPDELSDDLAPIDVSWGDFGDDGGGAAGGGTAGEGTGAADEPDPMARWDDIPESDSGSAGQAGAFARAVQQIGAEPSVDFIHVALPHNPWTLTPWGSSITKSIGEFPNLPRDRSDPDYDYVVRQRYQLQSMQIGAVDQLVGGLMDHLREVGAWEGTTLVVMSDHGTSMTPPDLGRRLTPGNEDDVLRIPLFVKAPGQEVGEVDDQPAHTYDVLPTLVDVLGVESDWEFEGHSLLDGSEPTVEPLIDDRTIFGALESASLHAGWFPRGEDWLGLVAVGDNADLVGLPVTDLAQGAPSDLEWRLDDGELLDDLPTDEGQVPYLLTGRFPGSPEEPPEVVVAVNGTLAGTIGAYEAKEGTWRFHGVVGPWFVDGANEVVAYEVERGADGVVLHEVGQGPPVG
jgi:hypothetical protein